MWVDTWLWPDSWNNKAGFNMITNPNLVTGQKDIVRWRNTNGMLIDYSVSQVWKAIRPSSEEVDWFKEVWFTQCIPCHFFLVWLIMHNSLKTHDRLQWWDVHSSVNIQDLVCPLCNFVPDSCAHMFLECWYASKLWIRVRGLAAMDNVAPVRYFPSSKAPF